MRRKALVIIFGALPASYLSVFAGVGVIFGLLAVLSGDEIEILLLGLGGIYGTVSLWIRAFRPPTTFTNVGLLAGIATLITMTWIWFPRIPLDQWTAENLLVMTYFSFAPLTVAVFLLSETARVTRI